MRVIGLTGSVAMGKSTTAAMLRRLGLPVFDADAAVHRLTAPGGVAVARVAARFPGCLDAAGGVDRARLRARVLGRPADLADLEAILHPLVAAGQARFLAACRRRRLPFAVLDIPLLLETRGRKGCDRVWVASAPATIQRQRVLARPGMTPERLKEILARQMPDAEKRRRADLVVPTGQGRRIALNRVRRALARLRRHPPEAR